MAVRQIQPEPPVLLFRTISCSRPSRTSQGNIFASSGSQQHCTVCVAGAAVTGIGWGAASSQRLHAFWPNFCTKLSQNPENFHNVDKNHGTRNMTVLVTIKSVLSPLFE